VHHLGGGGTQGVPVDLRHSRSPVLPG
jgi:hypothetical protein